MTAPPFGREEEKRWRVLESRALAVNPWFRLLQQQVAMPNGKATTYYSLDFAGVAVGAVARREGQILLVRQYRFLVDEFVWAIPSGGARADEDPAHAAVRELEEETGFTAHTVRPLLRYYPSYGCGNQVFSVFEATDVAATGDEFDRNEVLEVRWFAQDEVADMLDRGAIVDGLSLTPLLLLCAREGWRR